jgi:hypothetical protein
MKTIERRAPRLLDDAALLRLGRRARASLPGLTNPFPQQVRIGGAFRDRPPPSLAGLPGLALVDYVRFSGRMAADDVSFPRFVEMLREARELVEDVGDFEIDYRLDRRWTPQQSSQFDGQASVELHEGKLWLGFGLGSPMGPPDVPPEEYEALWNEDAQRKRALYAEVIRRARLPLVMVPERIMVPEGDEFDFHHTAGGRTIYKYWAFTGGFGPALFNCDVPGGEPEDMAERFRTAVGLLVSDLKPEWRWTLSLDEKERPGRRCQRAYEFLRSAGWPARTTEFSLWLHLDDLAGVCSARRFHLDGRLNTRTLLGALPLTGAKGRKPQFAHFLIRTRRNGHRLSVCLREDQAGRVAGLGRQLGVRFAP